MEIPRLHPDTIAEVKQRVDIVEVVSEQVVLRKRGKDYVGLCPFHDEKSPSFTVSPTKQMYYCFGCQSGGNAINFLMEVGKRSFSDVVLDLARRYQVSVQTLKTEDRQELQRQLSIREQLYEITAIASSFFQHTLRQPQGQKALEYLKERSFSEETIQQFQLGAAPQGWETLYRYLVEQKHFSVQLVEQAGLIKPRKSGGGYYDQFRDRLIIPISDSQGRIIGFGGRSLGDEQPKYLNSPETPIFEKGKTLFALDKAKKAIGKQDQAVVVEGYFDAIALHANGITNVVASLGTALSLDQVRQLLRYTESKQIVLNFDADTAGNNAAERAIGEIGNLAYQGQVQLRVLNLPDGKDADEFLKTSPEAAANYQELLQTSPLWLDWQIEQLLIGKDLKQADSFQQANDAMVKLLKGLSDRNLITHYIRHCAERLSQGDSRMVPLLVENLLTQVGKNPGKSAPRVATQRQEKKSPSPIPPTNRSLLEEAEALLLRLYLHSPEHRPDILEALEARDLLFSLPHHRFLWRQILQLQGGETESDSLISRLQDRINLSPELSAIAYLLHLDDHAQEAIYRAPLIIQAATACLEKVSWEKHRRYCLEQMQKVPLSETERWQYYSQEFNDADRRVKELEQLRQFTFSEILELRGNLFPDKSSL